METTFLYVLRDPESGEIRYVGKTDYPTKRLKDHQLEKGRSHRVNWFNNLKARGLGPQLEILLEVPISNWQFWERYYIKLFRESGFRLVNGTDGGEGTRLTGVSHPMWGKPRSQETRKKISIAGIGRPCSDETRKKRSQSLAGHPVSTETREKLHYANAGRNPAPEAHAAALAKNLGSRDSTETRERKRAAQQVRRTQEAAALSPIGGAGKQILISILLRFQDAERARGREKYYRKKEKELACHKVF